MFIGWKHKCQGDRGDISSRRPACRALRGDGVIAYWALGIPSTGRHYRESGVRKEDVEEEAVNHKTKFLQKVKLEHVLERKSYHYADCGWRTECEHREVYWVTLERGAQRKNKDEFRSQILWCKREQEVKWRQAVSSGLLRNWPCLVYRMVHVWGKQNDSRNEMWASRGAF